MNAPPSVHRLWRRSLAEELCDALARDLIFNDQVSPGDALPGEKDLAARYGVSRPTVRESLLMLQHDGLIEMRHGSGTYVLPRPRSLTHGLDRLCSIETFALEAGARMVTEDITWKEVKADRGMASRLAIPEGHRVLTVQRAKCLGPDRVGWLRDFIPEGVISFELLRAEFQGSTLDVILSHTELGAEYADSDITAVTLDDDLADRLAAPVGSPSLYIDTVVWTQSGLSLDWGTCWYRPDFFLFTVRRRHQLGDRVPARERRIVALEPFDK